MENLKKENTVLDTSKLTDEQKGIVFDIISAVDDWSNWTREEFIEDWGNTYLKDHATIVYAPNLNEDESYNSLLFFETQYGIETEMINVTFEQWVELHKPKSQQKVYTTQEIYDMYLDYVENYTLLTEFAKAYNISAVKAGLIINFGRGTKKLLNTLNR